MYKSIILPLAKEDIRETARWYNDKGFGLGRRFTADVREAILFVRENPLASPIRYDGVRTAILATFPYMIHYTIEMESQTVVVSALFHTSRNPEIWETR